MTSLFTPVLRYVHFLQDVGFLKQCASTYYRLATSPKAVNCTTASFLLQLLVCRRGKDFNEALKAIVQQTLGMLYLQNLSMRTLLPILHVVY